MTLNSVTGTMARSPSKRYMWIRGLMIFFCTLMAFSGILLLGVGVWLVCGATIFVTVLGTYSAQLNISYICIGMGAVLTLTSFIGTSGAWKENRCFLMLFFFIVTALFVGDFVSFILFLVYRELVSVMVLQASRKSLKEMYMGPAAADPISTAWNTVMIKFKCCGVENSTQDFRDSVFHKTTGLNYPITCCVDKTLPACDGMKIEPNLIQPVSCYSKLVAVIKEHSAVLGAAVGIICLTELAVMSLTIVLFLKLDMMQQDIEDY
ncbi:tetraspanin-16-like [Trichomycterus rosablanca]|uniref:tetraspanin-16-like n=1 Tax=Trichomycterus rosablanca TaxID=2290929 RepID=UPI002F357E75